MKVCQKIEFNSLRVNEAFESFVLTIFHIASSLFPGKEQGALLEPLGAQSFPFTLYWCNHTKRGELHPEVGRQIRSFWRGNLPSKPSYSCIGLLRCNGSS